MTLIDLSKIISRYKKEWLALSSDNKRLIATGRTLREALEKSKKEGVKDPSVFKAAPVGRFFAGSDEVFLY
jgi:hypothetical protein